MEHGNTLMHSLVKTQKRAWGDILCAFFRLNIEQITSAESTEDGNLVINNILYKFDVSDYTGCDDKYVFFNPISGRIVVENGGRRKIYKLEVDLFDEDEKF